MNPSIKTYLESMMPDRRSLGLFRIILGISLVYNLAVIKWSFIPQYWGSHPLIPPGVMQNLGGGFVKTISVFTFIHSDGFAYFIFGIGILSAIFLTVGFLSRIFSWFSLIIHWNIVQAYAAFSFGFDMFLFQILFWACFLPLDSEFSVKKQSNQTISVWPALVLIIQVTWIYFSTGMAKYGDSWTGGYAVRNMLVDYWGATELGKELSSNKLFYTATTYISLIVERLFPILVLLIPKYTWTRPVLCVFLALFHISIMLSYHVGSFSITGLAVAAFFIPGTWWEIIGLHSFHQLNLQWELPFQGWKKKTLGYLLILSIFIISWKNIFFLLEYSSLHLNSKFQKKVQKISHLNIPSPIHVSIFWQYWKMFAPNPPVKAGWFSLEELKEDGTVIDVISHKTVQEEPSVLWKPKQFELYLLMYSRTFDLPDSGTRKFRFFLKYWTLNHLKHINNQDFKNIFFTDYLFIIANQKSLSQTYVKRHILSVSKIIDENYEIGQGSIE